ncbi:MAG: DNA mismatch repair endonuclease MutL, partial [Enterobacteriaceae bacterium]
MPIQILPPQLANQIAAGEVVERPASVVKELMENSLDAGATRIDVDIEQGGAGLIRIRDNGGGIAQAELALALARHATSKIASLEDLEAINSLGFRGEALASISSVSRLTLTSRTVQQTEAWQAYAEGREMAVTVKPAAHPVGTTVEVRDLFYNTPGRRKFLRTEKTEFTHIDEFIRRLALARFDVAINLQHNGKLVRQYRPVQESAQRERRLAAVCGTTFVQHALALNWQHGDLAIEGWVVPPEAVKNATELQYCYVNGRIMRDRVINHAIRQAYQGQLRDDQQPAYVLYLQVDPHQLDVNVHPAKQEVRFHQGRLVHDFIYQAVFTALQHTQETAATGESPAAPQRVAVQENRQAAGENQFATAYKASPPAKRVAASGFSGGRAASPAPRDVRGWQQQSTLYHQLVQPAPQPARRLQETCLGSAVLESCQSEEPGVTLAAAEQGFGRVLTIIAPAFALLEYQHKIALLSLPVAERYLRQAQLTPAAESDLRAQPLLIPLQLKLSQTQLTTGRQHSALLTRLGIQLEWQPQHGLLRAVPLPVRQQNLQQLIPAMLDYLSTTDAATLESLIVWLAEHIDSEHTHWSLSQAIQILTEVERICLKLIKQPPAELLQFIDMEPTMTALQ